MVIIRDNTGKVIGTEASAHYTPMRKLRAANEQRLCDRAMGITRDEPTPEAIREREFEARLIANVNGASRF